MDHDKEKLRAFVDTLAELEAAAVEYAQALDEWKGSSWFAALFSGARFARYEDAQRRLTDAARAIRRLKEERDGRKSGPVV